MRARGRVRGRFFLFPLLIFFGYAEVRSSLMTTVLVAPEIANGEESDDDSRDQIEDADKLPADTWDAEKKRRRFGPVVTLAAELKLGIEQRRLKTALGELVT